MLYCFYLETRLSIEGLFLDARKQYYKLVLSFTPSVCVCGVEEGFNIAQCLRTTNGCGRGRGEEQHVHIPTYIYILSLTVAFGTYLDLV